MFDPSLVVWLALWLRHETVVVTGTVEPVPLGEADRAVRSIPVRGQALLFNDLTGILQLDPSLDLRQRGPGGIQADLSIRGSSFGQTLVLFNGRRMNDPQSGHHNLDLPVPLDAVESMEILRGAGSSLYGADALGGVVNIVTRAPERAEMKLRAAYGSFGTQQQRASVAGRKGTLSGRLAAARDFSTGFADDRDYRNLSLLSSLAWSGGGVDLGHADKPFGAAGFYGNFNSWERTKTWFASLHQRVDARTEGAFTFRRHTDLFVLYRDRPAVYTNHHEAESWQGSLRRRAELTSTLSLSYGGEVFGERLASSNLGRHERRRGAVYAGVDQRVFRRSSFSAGVRGETYRGLPGQWSPSVAGGLWLSGTLKWRASVSRAFRVPTYTDLYYQDPANRGNPGLRPESAWSYESGLEWRPAARLRWEGTVFHRRERDGIDYIRATPAEPWQAANIHRLRFTGVEYAVRYAAGASVLDVSYTGLRAEGAGAELLLSKYVFSYPVHAAVAGWRASVGRQLVFRTRLGAVARRGRDPYAVWDVSVARATGRWRPFLQASNLTGTRYQEIVGVAMPPRSLLGGMEWNW